MDRRPVSTNLLAMLMTHRDVPPTPFSQIPLTDARHSSAGELRQTALKQPITESDARTLGGWLDLLRHEATHEDVARRLARIDQILEKIGEIIQHKKNEKAAEAITAGYTTLRQDLKALDLLVDHDPTLRIGLDDAGLERLTARISRAMREQSGKSNPTHER